MRGAILSCFFGLLISSGVCSWSGADDMHTKSQLPLKLPGSPSHSHQVIRKSEPSFQASNYLDISPNFFRRSSHRTFFFEESFFISNHRAGTPFYDFANGALVVLADSFPWIFQAKNGASGDKKTSVNPSTGEASSSSNGEQENGQGTHTIPGQSGGASGGGASGGDDGKKPPSDQKTIDKQQAEAEEREKDEFWDLLMEALKETEFEAVFRWLEDHPDFVDMLDDTAVQDIHDALFCNKVTESIIRRFPERLRPPVIFASHLCTDIEQIYAICSSYDFYHTSVVLTSSESSQTGSASENKDEDGQSVTSSAGSSETSVRPKSSASSGNSREEEWDISVSPATGLTKPKSKRERKREKQSGYYDLVASPSEEPESEADREKREAMEAEKRAKKEAKREKQKRKQQEIKWKKQQEKAEKKREEAESDVSLNTAPEINPDNPFIELLSSPAIAADVATQGASAVVSRQSSLLRRKKSESQPLPQPPDKDEEVKRIATTIIDLVIEGKSPTVEINNGGDMQLQVEVIDMQYHPPQPEASQSLQFNGESVVLSTLEEFSDFLLHQDINADQLWAIIEPAVSASIQNQQIPNGLLWLLWKAARGNLNALYALVEAHARQLANRPDRLLRTIRRYWLVSSGSLAQPEPCSFSEARWTKHLSGLLDSAQKRGDTRPGSGLNHKIRRLIMDAWKAYINKKNQQASEKIRTLQKKDQGAAIAFLERVIHPPGNGEKTENLPGSGERHSRWLLPHDRPESFIPSGVYTDIAVQLISLARQGLWDIFLRLYNAMLDSLRVQNPGISTPDILNILAREVDTTVLHGLIGSLTQHSETAGAATILIQAVMAGHLGEVACSQCGETHFNTQRLVCKECNPDPFYLCQSCFSNLPQVAEGACCVTDNCPGIFIHSQDTELTNLLTQQINQCPLPVLEEIVIEVPFLAAAGHNELALALLDADFNLAGILPDTPGTHAAVLRFLLVEFFDQPERLQTILQLIKGNVGLNWFEKLIKAILEKMQTVSEVQGCSASSPGNSEKS